MPYRRTYRKRTFRKRTTNRNYRKRFTKRTRTSKRGQKLYLFKRHCAPFGALTINDITNTYTAYNFSLNDVPNVSEFTTLYDVYKINAVKITFRPQMTDNVSLSSINNAAASNRFFTAIDYNDSVSPTSIDEIRQYQSCKVTGLLRTHKRYFRPRIMDSSSVYSPGNKWLNTATTSTNYFGLKVAVEPTQSTIATSMTYSIECTYYLSFKNVK